MVRSAKARVAIKRQWLFAALMSMVTVNIVSISILLIHHVPVGLLLEKWLTSILVAWPIVFTTILLVAPWLLRLTHKLVKDQD